MISDDDDARRLLEQVITAARCLPADGWHSRIIEGGRLWPDRKISNPGSGTDFCPQQWL